ncbi:MAG: 50S ribosomal protein L32 [Deltaproteobacteria bacterium]|nr:50S ribosomal protein L32 [Deltaproteobacteria bacterium]
MTVPKRRLSKMKGRQRRSHYKALAPTVVGCAICGAPVRPHMICGKCGQYRRRAFAKITAQTTNAPAGSAE